MSTHPDIATDVVFALVLYSFAEHQAGHASVIRVAMQGSTFAVADNGRGHSIDRLVGQTPYLELVYTHLDYPFRGEQAPLVQLQGIGISLINSLCSELSVTVKRPDATLRLSFNEGRLRGRELVSVSSEESGNLVAGTIHPRYGVGAVETRSLESRLRGLLAASSRLKLFFNEVLLNVGA